MPSKDRCGYLNVKLHKDAHGKMMSVHRLVAIAFIPNPNNLPQVNHKDCNKTNNCVDNLEWITNRDNVIYAFKNGDRHISEEGREQWRKNIKSAQEAQRTKVVKLDNDYNLISIYDSITDANKSINFDKSSGHIGQCCKGIRKSAGGFKWMYYEDYLMIKENVI